MRRPKLTYSNVAATLALFVALGGGAYALTLGKGAVKRKHIARNAVTSKKIAPNAVKGIDALESSFGTVPRAANATNADNATRLGGLGPGLYTQGINAVQRVGVQSVGIAQDGLSFQISGVGTIQFQNCQTPQAATRIGNVVYDNTSTDTQDVWDTIYGDDAADVPDVQHFTEAPPGNINLSPSYVFGNDDDAVRLDLQIASRTDPSKVVNATLTAFYDFEASPDVCRVALWTTKLEAELG